MVPQPTGLPLGAQAGLVEFKSPPYMAVPYRLPCVSITTGPYGYDPSAPPVKVQSRTHRSESIRTRLRNPTLQSLPRNNRRPVLPLSSYRKDFPGCR